MKAKLVGKTKTDAGSKDLPEQFLEPIRPDLIKRAVLTLQANKRQKYGSMIGAGMRHSAELSRRRRKYRGSYGFGISRVQRKILSRRGTRFNWAGAVVPGTVGGRKAHPPKAEKNWEIKLNVKENRKAIRSALAATVQKGLVENRGHKLPKEYPLIVKTELETIKKTSDLTDSLRKLGFKEELERTAETSTRAGKGKMRGRRKKTKKGLLIVTSSHESPVMKAAKNVPGVDVTCVRHLNAELLAPGADYGRITLFTEGAIDLLNKEKLFTKNYRAPKEEKK